MTVMLQKIPLDADKPPCLHCILHDFAGPLVHALTEAYPPAKFPKFRREIMEDIVQWTAEVIAVGAQEQLPLILPTLVKKLQDRAIEVAEEAIDG